MRDYIMQCVPEYSGKMHYHTRPNTLFFGISVMAKLWLGIESMSPTLSFFRINQIQASGDAGDRIAGGMSEKN